MASGGLRGRAPASSHRIRGEERKPETSIRPLGPLWWRIRVRERALPRPRARSAQAPTLKARRRGPETRQADAVATDVADRNQARNLGPAAVMTHPMA